MNPFTGQVSSWRRFSTGALGVAVLLGGCMPLNADQTTAPAEQPSPPAIAAPAATGQSASGGLTERIVRTASTVQTGTFVLVVATSMASGNLTMRYQGSFNVTNPTTPLCRVDGTQNGQMLTVIVAGDALYTKVGTAKYSKSSVSGSIGKLGLASMRPDLPTLVGLVGSSVRGLTYVGPDTVSGIDVQHWRALVDASVFAPGATGTTFVDFWVDASDLVHQISYSLTSAGLATSVATVTYADFNQPVDVSEPAASEVR